MSFLTFEPKEEKDLTDLLEPGMGSFQVSKAIYTTSKISNKPMIRLILKVWDQKGKEGVIFDNLILDESNFSLRRIRHFCLGAGLKELYDQGKLDPMDCEGKSGNIIIGIQKDKKEEYPDKNIVKDYIAAEDQKSLKISTPIIDDLPF